MCESTGDSALLQGWPAGMTSGKGISYPLSESNPESHLIHDEAKD